MQLSAAYAPDVVFFHRCREPVLVGRPHKIKRRNGGRSTIYTVNGKEPASELTTSQEAGPDSREHMRTATSRNFSAARPALASQNRSSDSVGAG